ncbi:MAG: hypothetical protein KGZ63_01105 [Clostridiales bacterium]|jgi:hypothetical protein|nr:hypothetical protein [Clostridiales bacterium]
MYFEQRGRENTERTLSLAVQRGKELGLQYYVVASNTGETAEKLVASGVDVTCVTHHTGYQKPGHQELAPNVAAKLSAAGVRVLTTTHLLGGIDRGVDNKFGGSSPAGIVSATLRMFGQGTKVCVEIAVMALDAGLIPYGEDIVAIGGSGKGADTSLIIRPAHAKDFFSCEIKEIICKPRNV